MALAAAALLMSGCGGAPSKAQFTERMRTSVGDLAEGLATAGIDAAEGDRLIDRFVSCQYDAIAGDEDLLQQVYDQPGSVESTTELDVRAKSCVDELTAAVSAAADPSKAVPATTTTVPGPPTTPPALALPSTPTSGG